MMGRMGIKDRKNTYQSAKEVVIVRTVHADILNL